MKAPPRDWLAEACDLACTIRVDAEVLDNVVRRGAEAGEQVAAAERLAERAREIVRAATEVGRQAARRPASDTGKALPANAVGELRTLVRQRVRDENRSRRRLRGER